MAEASVVGLMMLKDEGAEKPEEDEPREIEDPDVDPRAGTRAAQQMASANGVHALHDDGLMQLIQ